MHERKAPTAQAQSLPVDDFLASVLALQALNCRPFVFIVVWCIASQVDRMMKQQNTSIIALKCFRSFVHHAVQTCGSIMRGRSKAVRIAVHRYHTYNIRFQLLRQKMVSAYNISAICCNSHVQGNTLSSNPFTSTEGKTISRLSDFRVSLQNFRVSFWHPKTAWKKHCSNAFIFKIPAPGRDFQNTGFSPALAKLAVIYRTGRWNSRPSGKHIKLVKPHVVACSDRKNFWSVGLYNERTESTV